MKDLLDFANLLKFIVDHEICTITDYFVLM